MNSFRIPVLSMLCCFCYPLPAPATGQTTALFNEGIYLIPYPQEVNLGGEDFVPGKVAVHCTGQECPG